MFEKISSCLGLSLISFRFKHKLLSGLQNFHISVITSQTRQKEPEAKFKKFSREKKGDNKVGTEVETY